MRLRHLKIATVQNCFYGVAHHLREELAYFRVSVGPPHFLSFFLFRLLLVLFTLFRPTVSF